MYSRGTGNRTTNHVSEQHKVSRLSGTDARAEAFDFVVVGLGSCDYIALDRLAQRRLEASRLRALLKTHLDLACYRALPAL